LGLPLFIKYLLNIIMIESIEEGRKEDGNRSIADKIIKRLHDLEKTVENNKGRWVWELLQNAKDSIADGSEDDVQVQIEMKNDRVEFRHTGNHFTEKDIRGLINQISSKEVQEGEHSNKTGRFGTGFITTHLLSKVIQVKGIVETKSGDFYRFSFPLDRRGKTTAQLVPNIEKAWEEFHKSAMKISANYNKEYNTSFCYLLQTPEQMDIAKNGVAEFAKLVPYVLVSIPKITKVEIFDNLNRNVVTFSNVGGSLLDSFTTIRKVDNAGQQDIRILSARNQRVSIAIELEQIGNQYAVKSLDGIPKLFCDFPLIGTENFHFPVVVNSFYFSPQTERDGIWLKGQAGDPEVKENQELLKEAVSIYRILLNEAAKAGYTSLYNMADTHKPQVDEKYIDENWYKTNIQEKLREIVWSAPIVETEDDTLIKKAVKDLWFPLKGYSGEIRENLWAFNFSLYPYAVCKKEHLHEWCDLSWEGWNRLSYQQLVDALVKQGSLASLCDTIKKDAIEGMKWINAVGEFIGADDTNLAMFEKHAITPNKKGVFKIRSKLHIDKIGDSDLLKILKLLGEDWDEILVHDYLSFGRYVVKEKKDIAARITELLKPSQANDKMVEAISLLSEWFEYNSELGKTLFADLYRRRAELFMNTIHDKESLYNLMRSKTDLARLAQVAKAIETVPNIEDTIKKADDLTKLLKEFNASDVMYPTDQPILPIGNKWDRFAGKKTHGKINSRSNV
jgi:hypothetical protein